MLKRFQTNMYTNEKTRNRLGHKMTKRLKQKINQLIKGWETFRLKLGNIENRLEWFEKDKQNTGSEYQNQEIQQIGIRNAWIKIISVEIKKFFVWQLSSKNSVYWLLESNRTTNRQTEQTNREKRSECKSSRFIFYCSDFWTNSTVCSRE